MSRDRSGNVTETRPRPGGAGVVNRRARQRALVVGVVSDAPNGERDELAELKELLRTGGIATAGELVQRRIAPIRTATSAAARSPS